MLEHLDAWLQSATFRPLGPALLVPVRLQLGAAAIQCGQANLYILTDPAGQRWYLKKFKPNRQLDLKYVSATAACIPLRPQFEAGTRRVVISRSTLDPASFDADFADQLDGTVLAPRIIGNAWSSFLHQMIDGKGLSLNERVAISLDLAASIEALEAAGISHRDLSTGNLLVNAAEKRVNLIDWDSLYHASLPFQRNTTCGTPGHTAPWTFEDPRASWCEHADRYALAVCVAEILGARPGLRPHNDGGLLSQERAARPSPDSVQALRAALADVCQGADVLLNRALEASSFDDCPTPAEWITSLQSLLPLPAIPLHDLAEGTLASFGAWRIMRTTRRLCIVNAHQTVAIEFTLTSMGAFQMHTHGVDTLIFADGGPPRSGRFQTDWRVAMKDKPALAIDQGANPLGNYVFSVGNDAMTVRNVCCGLTITLPRTGDEPRIETLVGDARLEAVSA